MVKNLIVVITSIIFGGCAALNSINNKEELNDNNTVIAVDAKQRFIISKEIVKRTKSGVPDENTGIIGNCVEPSPDVFAAISSAVEGSFNKADSISAIAKAAMSESAGTIGIRTEAIQLLRDAMFRLCEGYINGSITQSKYEELHEKYQKSMVTLAAVGALADSARPVQLALGGQASLTRSELVKMLLEDKKNAESKILTTKEDIKQADIEFESSLDVVCEKDEVTCDPLPDGKSTEEEVAIEYCSQEAQASDEQCNDFESKKQNKSEATEANKNAEDDLKRIKEDLEYAKTNDNLMVTNSVNWSPNSPTQPSTKNIQEVAKVVQELVKQVYQDSWFERCLTFQEERKIKNSKIEEKREIIAKLEDENKKLTNASNDLVSANKNLSQIPENSEALKMLGLTKYQIRNNQAILKRAQQKFQEDIERNQNQINKANSEVKSLYDSKTKYDKSMEEMNCGLFVELN